MFNEIYKIKYILIVCENLNERQPKRKLNKSHILHEKFSLNKFQNLL